MHWDHAPGAMERATIIKLNSLKCDIGKMPLTVGFGRFRQLRPLAVLLKKAYKKAFGVEYDSPLPHPGMIQFEFPLFRRNCVFNQRLVNEVIEDYLERHYLGIFPGGYNINVIRMMHEGRPDLTGSAAIKGKYCHVGSTIGHALWTRSEHELFGNTKIKLS